ncbi:phytanoyl-CoA dioxygenase family protein [Paenibacillus thalictri]|uniref:Phytanoyl-CoA dioxygenase family protein n=2 Tax=Paenibacillus thalictri TaxID=2527873 RepID=A0A4Q9DJW0_9BACL|nr:phytanoyl-CoA dioxygenase family protein [Paenibacillus thalictri]
MNLALLTAEQKEQFDTDGYLIVRKVFSEDELGEIKTTFEQISQTTVPGYFEPVLDESADPLKRYPRIVHPHRFNAVAMKYMLHPKVMRIMEDLYQEEALAAQSMFYYKPPGSRGQALHQDNFYLKVEPGNCIAAWTAIDPAEEENGGMLIVPRTHQFDLVCPDTADEKESFTTHLVKPPKDRKPVPAVMDAGDVLLFNGNMIHGSYRNKTKDRFRRSFICHYANASATMIANFYRPLYRADGRPVDLALNPHGGPCGIEFTAPYGAH